MTEAVVLALQVSLPALVIPAAVLAGMRLRGGPATLMGVGAPLALLALWLLGQSGVLQGENGQVYSYAETYLLIGAALLLIGAWAIALAAAASARRWGWVALLTLAVYLSFYVFIAMLFSTNSNCLFNAQAPGCGASAQSLLPPFLASAFIGPVAILAYTLLARQPRRRAALPDGLLATPISAPAEPAPDAPTSSGHGEPGAGE